MPAPDSFDIDELVRHGQLTAAAGDGKGKQPSDSPAADPSSRYSDRNGHDTARSPTSDRGRAQSPARSTRESRYSSSRGSPRDHDDRRRSIYARRRSPDERDRRSSRHDHHDRYSHDRTRHRSRSPYSSRHRSSYRERSTSRDLDRYSRRSDRRDRSRSRDRRDAHERPPYSARGHRDGPYSSSRDATAAGPATDGSDNRTVFVQQLAMRVTEAHLYKFFSEAGPVEKVTIIGERSTGRSKGFGYVQFKDLANVERAVGLTGRKIMGVPIIVSLTEADKNRAAKKTESLSAQNGVPFHRLYVGNIHFSVTEDDLKDMFGVYGELAMAELTRDNNGRSRGYAFVQFIEPEDAKTALSKLNGFELAGRPLRVGLGREDRAEGAGDGSTQRSDPRASSSNNYQGSDFSGAGGRTANARANTDRDAGRGASGAAGSGALDDNDSGGVNYSNYSRHALMQRLAREEDALPVVPNTGNRNTVAAPSNSATVTKSNPSRCVLVKNAYNEAEETDPDWVQDLETDFKTECSESYGEVVFCALYRDSPDGDIYLKFKDVRGGDKAIKGLSGRNFGGRMLRAEPVVDAIFNTVFPAATNL